MGRPHERVHVVGVVRRQASNGPVAQGACIGHALAALIAVGASLPDAWTAQILPFELDAPRDVLRSIDSLNDAVVGEKDRTSR